ncbi:(d)CMP kinase [Alcaligenes sp. SDU_A2]|uniref:(d)CMP kinase n=1 Tax=Alcaligenes sp. SDU_A2 TaxID=3136634 RepID=UPI00311F96CF
MSATQTIPVITIDGPTASGKGTIAHLVAERLGWHTLDSGALYRLTALACLRQGLDTELESEVERVAAGLDIRFQHPAVFLAGQDVSEAIRQEQVGNLASQVAAMPGVRAALLQRQRDFRIAPGLVGDGRDMGTVVFPDAPLKIFLLADAQVRAERRCKQLSEKGISANLASLLADLRARDARDKNRTHAPLVPAQDAHIVDSSKLSIDETVNIVLDLWSGVSFPTA